MALLAIPAAVREYFETEGIPVDVVFGWRERAMQINRTKGARIVFQPGDDNGRAGKLGPPKQTTATPARQLLTWAVLFSVSVWTYDPEAAPTDTEAHTARLVDLFEHLVRAVHLAAAGRYALDSLEWTVVRENTDGAELTFLLSVDMPLFDAGAVLVQATPNFSRAPKAPPT